MYNIHIFFYIVNQPFEWVINRLDSIILAVIVSKKQYWILFSQCTFWNNASMKKKKQLDWIRII